VTSPGSYSASFGSEELRDRSYPGRRKLRRSSIDPFRPKMTTSRGPSPNCSIEKRARGGVRLPALDLDFAVDSNDPPSSDAEDQDVAWLPLASDE
jgi:hypothetical protein